MVDLDLLMFGLRSNGWENARLTSLFASLKKGLVHHELHRSRASANPSKRSPTAYNYTR
jgi:hypothetical protein